MTRSPLPFAAILACCLTACSAPAPQGESSAGADAAGDRATPSTPANPPTVVNDGRGISAPVDELIEDPAPTPDPVSATTPTADAADGSRTCDGGKVRSMIGEVASAAVVQSAVAGSGARTARVIKPGMAVTMDYLTDRLNVHVDDNNVITQLACG